MLLYKIGHYFLDIQYKNNGDMKYKVWKEGLKGKHEEGMERRYGRKVWKEGIEGTYGRNVWEKRIGERYRRKVWREGM